MAFRKDYAESLDTEIKQSDRHTQE